MQPKKKIEVSLLKKEDKKKAIESEQTQSYVCGEANSMKNEIIEHIKDTHFQDVKNSICMAVQENFSAKSAGQVSFNLC